MLPEEYLIGIAKTGVVILSLEFADRKKYPSVSDAEWASINLNCKDDDRCAK
jgi:hypothetical protein